MIRPLQLSDLKAYAGLRMQAIRDYPLSFGAEPDAPFNYDRARKVLATFDPENFVLGYFQEGQLAGMIGFLRLSNKKLRHKGLIWGMYVHPGHQGKGIGGRLITAALQHISPLEGLEKVCLSVTDQSPAAHKLYLKMGFSEYGREANAMQWEGLLMTEIFMHKIL